MSEYDTYTPETDSKASVKTLSKSLNEVILDKSQWSKIGDSTEGVDVILFEKSADAFSSVYLQKSDDLSGAVGIRERQDEDGSVHYSVTRPGYHDSVLQYRWDEGGSDVQVGFSQGFYRVANGMGAGQGEVEQLPRTLSPEEITKFSGLVADLKNTHMTYAERKHDEQSKHKVKSLASDTLKKIMNR